MKSERELTERAGTRDHQGLVASVEPYRYADAYELAAQPQPLLAVLDRVTDPRNLGAVCRSADGAGATGVIVPAHGSAVVTPAVARASAGAVEHLPVAVVTNLARYLEEVKGPDLWVYGAAGGEDATPMWEADLAGGVALVFGAEGKGLRPLVRRMCDGARVDPAVRPRRVAQRQRGRRGAAVRGATASWLTSISSTATTSCTPGRSPTLASSSTRWRVSSRSAARAGWSSSTGSAWTTRAARSRCASPSTPTRCSRASPSHSRRATT